MAAPDIEISHQKASSKEQDLLNSYEEYMTTKSLITKRSCRRSPIATHQLSEQTENCEISVHKLRPVLSHESKEEQTSKQHR